MVLDLQFLANFDHWLAGTSVLASAAAAFLAFRNLRLARSRSSLNIATHEILNNLTEGYYRASLDGEMVFANSALARLCGHETPEDFISSKNQSRQGLYVCHNRRAEFLAKLLAEGRVTDFTSEIRLPASGRQIWISENARVVRDSKTGKPSHYEGTVRDATDFVLRMAEKEMLIKLTSQVPGGLFQLERGADGKFAVVFASQGFRDLLDSRCNDEKFDINRFLAIIHPDDLAGYHSALRASRRNMTQWQHEFRVVTDGGKFKWLRVQGAPETSHDGRLIWHGYLQDVTSHKADVAEIKSLAYNDTLTQLPNRRLLLDRLQQTIAGCARRNECAAVLFIDLDNFKVLNDTHGHDVGDLLLVEIAKRLKRLVRRNDTVARLAGDEFVVLLDGLGRDKDTANQRVAAISEKILGSFRRGFELGSFQHATTASIGAITFDGNAKSVESILKYADTAMYEVKKNGRNAFRIFEQGKDLQTSEQLMLAEDLKQVVQNGELEMRLQPQVNREGRITGAEALIRWNHPALGMLTPDKFMPLAEQRGHIRQISRYVVESAFRLLGEWQSGANTSALSLSVNVSAQQFLSNEFADEIRDLIRKYKVAPAKFVLELTEQVISKNKDNAIRAMERLKTTGIRLSIDDFGTGFSSLSHLKDMPLDEIKIDGKFVRMMQDKPKNRALVKTILAMAEALDLATVAEHVETAEQEQFLISHGCDRFQGYLYSGAMTRRDFEDMAARGSGNGVAPMLASAA